MNLNEMLFGTGSTLFISEEPHGGVDYYGVEWDLGCGIQSVKRTAKGALDLAESNKNGIGTAFVQYKDNTRRYMRR